MLRVPAAARAVALPWSRLPLRSRLFTFRDGLVIAQEDFGTREEAVAVPARAAGSAVRPLRRRRRRA